MLKAKNRREQQCKCAHGHTYRGATSRVKCTRKDGISVCCSSHVVIYAIQRPLNRDLMGSLCGLECEQPEG